MENLKKNKILYISICVIITIICIIICYIIDKSNKNENYDYTQLTQENNLQNENNISDIYKNTEEKQIIYVHIAGEVISPGIYSIEEGSRIKDVIDKAGGLTENADTEKINLAYQISDGQKIKIPNVNDKNEVENYIIEEGGENIVISDNNTKTKTKVNINTATQTELETLTGIGPSIASRIIEYRESNGKFKNIEEIKNVSGIGDAKYKKIENEITVK